MRSWTSNWSWETKEGAGADGVGVGWVVPPPPVPSFVPLPNPLSPPSFCRSGAGEPVRSGVDESLCLIVEERLEGVWVSGVGVELVGEGWWC